MLHMFVGSNKANVFIVKDLFSQQAISGEVYTGEDLRGLARFTRQQIFIKNYLIAIQVP